MQQRQLLIKIKKKHLIFKIFIVFINIIFLKELHFYVYLKVAVWPRESDKQ